MQVTAHQQLGFVVGRMHQARAEGQVTDQLKSLDINTSNHAFMADIKKTVESD